MERLLILTKSIEYKSITLPNLLENPYSIQQVELGGQSYFFEFDWNTRHERAYFSIYIKQDDEVVYLLKPTCLINSRSLSKNITNEKWSGYLDFARIIGSTEADYRIDNLHEYFVLNYFYDED